MDASQTPLVDLIRQSIELDEIHSCFFQADRLNENAYQILNEFPLTASSIQRFSAAKLIADAKYAEARLRWDAFKQNRCE